MLFDERILAHKIALWFLDRVPKWLRNKGWFRQFYWQKEDFELADKRAKKFMESIKWE